MTKNNEDKLKPADLARRYFIGHDFNSNDSTPTERMIYFRMLDAMEEYASIQSADLIKQIEESDKEIHDLTIAKDELFDKAIKLKQQIESLMGVIESQKLTHDSLLKRISKYE